MADDDPIGMLRITLRLSAVFWILTATLIWALS